MGVYGFSGLCGFLWVFMSFWVCVGVYECLCVSMGVYEFVGCLLVTVGVHGGRKCLWVFGGVYGCIWVSMGVFIFLNVYGCLWVYIAV